MSKSEEDTAIPVSLISGSPDAELCLIYGHDQHVAAWVAKRVPPMTNIEGVASIGVAEKGKLVAGVVYSNFTPWNCEISIASSNPRWASKGRLFAFFFYPFVELKLERVTASTTKNNRSARRLLEGLGFKLEGIGRRAYDGIRDAYVYGLLKDECKWIKGACRG